MCIFNFAGKLEIDDDENYFVRVGGDSRVGVMGIGFRLIDVSSLEKRVYGGLRIILK